MDLNFDKYSPYQKCVISCTVKIYAVGASEARYKSVKLRGVALQKTLFLPQRLFAESAYGRDVNDLY